MGNTDSLTFNLGIRFAAINMDKMGRDYWDESVGFGATWWPDSWVGLEGSALFNHTSSNEWTLGSRRTFGTIELTPKFRLPFAFVDHIYISPYASISAGASWLNFGGGNNPELSFDAVADFGGLCGVMFAATDDLGLEFYAGYSAGFSLARGHYDSFYYSDDVRALGENYKEDSIFGGLKFTYGPQAKYQPF